MDKKRFAWIAGIGCVGLLVLLAIIALPLLLIPIQVRRIMASEQPTATVMAAATAAPEALATQDFIRHEALPGLTDEKRGVLEANGVEINFLSEDEISTWRAAAEEIWDSWAASDPDHQQALDIARKAIGL